MSAFCNAGFSLYSTSLEAFYNRPLTVITFSLLIIAGGLGFFTLDDVVNRVRLRSRRFSLNTKLVLVSTGLLLAGGTVLIFLLERNGALAAQSWPVGLLNAFFQAVTSRTAGFNTLPIGVLAPASAVVLICLMFIGASSGSCGGGIKTGTISVIMLTIKSSLMGKEQVEAFSKSIPNEVVFRAVTVVVGAALLVFTGCIVILAVEGTRFYFLDVIFEVVSAFGTVGLSRGITTQLSPASQVTLTLLMFGGRVGLLNLAFAVRRLEAARIEYPEENVMIG